MKKILLLLILSTILFSNETKLNIGNFSVGLITNSNTCYEMNDVDAFYVYKLYKDYKLTKIKIEKAKGGTIVKAVESYKDEYITYTFFDSFETCQKYKDK